MKSETFQRDFFPVDAHAERPDFLQTLPKNNSMTRGKKSKQCEGQE